MDRNTRNALIASAAGAVVLSILQAASYTDYLDIIVQYVGYITPVVDTILSFVGPYLQGAGAFITGYINQLLNILPFEDYTYYMLIAIVIFSLGLILAIKKPGIQEPDEE